MPELTCYLGTLDRGATLPLLPSLGGASIAQLLAAAGADSSGKPLVDITFDASRATTTQIEVKGAASALDLHTAVRELTRKLPSMGGLRKKVALVFAERWSGQPGVLGLMFDIGFSDIYLGSNKANSAVPREGCAVFLSAISALRQAQGDTAIQRQTAWTALHELGHLFNLWHRDDPIRFMSSSDSQGVYDPAAPPLGADGATRDVAYAYADEHRSFLESCLARGLDDPAAAYAWPGGERFGSRGGWPVDTDYREVLRAARPSPACALTLRLSQAEGWSFDPVELDICLQLASGRRQPLTLPAKVDPGYDEFAIWIECPDGSRFRYRSPRRYCENTDRIRLAPGNTFARDVSIFGQAGGFTFIQPGVYEIFATWKLPAQVLISNRVSIEIKDGNRLRGADARRREILSLPEAAGLLYHRMFRQIGRGVAGVRALCELARNTTDRRLRVDVSYALGRAYLKASTRAVGSTRSYAQKRARDWLGVVLDDCDVASPRRLHHSAEALENLRLEVRPRCRASKAILGASK